MDMERLVNKERSMKKKLSGIIILILAMFCFKSNVYADYVGISSSSNSIIKGNSVTITATVYTSSPIAAIEGTLYCSGAGVAGGVDMNFDDSTNSMYSKSYSYIATPSSTGTITCTTSSVQSYDYVKGTFVSLGGQSISISVSEPVALPNRTYSSNNNLSSISVDGYKISPEFKKDTLEYILTVPNNINKIKINTKTEDSTASVSGGGEVSVAEGTNKIAIKVTAENGNEKTYILNVTVEELNPITITINKEKYTVIRKEGVLDAPSIMYEKTTTKINNEDVFAYYNKVTKYTLVGLRDSKGNSNYYIYDSKKKTYTLYKEIVTGGLILYQIDMGKNKLSDFYKESSLKIDDNKIVAYCLSDYCVFNAVNVETGKENLYSYDKIEKTVQRYNIKEAALFENQNKRLLYITIGLVSVLGLSLIGLAIYLLKKNKKHSHKKENK